MGWDASIRVMTTDGEPRSGAKVTISFSGIIGTIDSEYTDSDGWATFDYPNIEKESMGVDTIWVDSEEVDSGGALEGGETRSYTVE